MMWDCGTIARKPGGLILGTCFLLVLNIPGTMIEFNLFGCELTTAVLIVLGRLYELNPSV
jgi:hypothetical protein